MSEEIKGEQLESANYTNIKESIINNEVDLQSDIGVTDGEQKDNVSSSSSSFGKFNSAEDLLSAYNNLQAEFTRKCQKLSELKKVGAEQQREYLSNDWDDKVAQFVSQNQNAKKYAKEICDVLLSDDIISQSKDSLKLAYQKVLSSKYKEPEDLINDEDFIKKFAENEKVRDYVLKLSLKNASVAPNIMGAKGSSLVKSKDVPTSIGEAGQIVLGLFKSKK